MRGEYDPRTPHEFGWRQVAVIAVLALAFLLLGILAASAAPMLCGNRDAMVESLGATAHGERQRATGVIAGGSAIVEFFAGEKGNWTQLITRTDGISCKAFFGDGWTMIVPAKPSY